MFLGHQGLTLAAKHVAPETSFGTLFLATQLSRLSLADLSFARLEHVRTARSVTILNLRSILALFFEQGPKT